jgi:ribose transport system permease protein
MRTAYRSSDTGSPRPAFGSSRSLQYVANLAKRNSIWLFLVIAVAFFGLESPHFLTVTNLSNILVQGAFIGVLAIGMTLVMINGNIDLSVGSILGLGACLAVGLQPHGIWVGVTGALTAGLLLGWLNGLIVEKTGVSSFIVTLGGMIGIRGLVFVYTGENSLSSENMAYIDFSMLSVGPISIIAVVFVVLLVLFQWILAQTPHGRDAYAIGGNRAAAINAGTRVSRHVIVNFMIAGLLAAVTGILMSTQMGAATPNLGSSYELWSIIAVVLGGTRLTGGVGTMWGTLGGVLTLAVLRNGMNLIQVEPFYVLIILGFALIVALILEKQITVD